MSLRLTCSTAGAAASMSPPQEQPSENRKEPSYGISQSADMVGFPDSGLLAVLLTCGMKEKVNRFELRCASCQRASILPLRSYC